MPDGSRFFDWTPGPEPVQVVPIQHPDDYQALKRFYAHSPGSRPLDRVFEVASEHQVRSVVVEYRYIDVDYRDEHSRFYSTTFRRYPSVAHRLHFFTDDVKPDCSNLSDLKGAYRGYSVMRPLERSPVGRTVLTPPPELLGNDATATLVTDRVNLLGETFQVRGAPFISQDAQYMRCAHAATWMVLYHGHLLYGLPRRLPGDIHDAGIGGYVTAKQLPSAGLSVPQMLSGLHELGMPADRVHLPPDRVSSKAAGALSLMAVLCRYVNSQTPPIVVSHSHAWVVVGYRNLGTGPAHDNIVFYRNDDAMGPYIRVTDPWNEPLTAHSPWLLALPPMPRKVYLPAERAELLGWRWLMRAARKENAAPLLDAERDGRLTFMTYAIRSTDYKAGLPSRGMQSDVARAYRFAQMSRYIWVTEAIDRAARDARAPCVLGEAIIDATAHQHTDAYDDEAEALLGLHVPGRALLHPPDFSGYVDVGYDGFGAYRTSCPVVYFY
jgi:hypothetical protein